MANNLSIFLRDICSEIVFTTAAHVLKWVVFATQLHQKVKNSLSNTDNTWQLLIYMTSREICINPLKSSAGQVKTHFSVLQSRLGQHCIRHTENKMYNSKRLSIKLLHRESHQIVSAELTFLCQLRQRRQLVAVFVCSTLSRFSNHRHIRRYITNYR